MTNSSVIIGSKSKISVSKSIEKISLKVSPVILGASLVAGALGLSSNQSNIQINKDTHINLDNIMNILSGLTDLSAIGANLNTRPNAVLGNLLRTILNFTMSIDNENIQNIANQLFQLVSTFIKISWAIGENPELRIKRDEIKDTKKKFTFEISETMNWLQTRTNPAHYTNNWTREFKQYGLKGFMGRRTSGLLMASAFTGLIGGGFLIANNLLFSKNQKNKNTSPENNNKSLFENIGWALTKTSLGLLTFSYLTKYLSTSYKQFNHALAPILSLATFLATTAQTVFADNPKIAGYTRFISNIFSGISSWLEARSLVKK